MKTEVKKKGNVLHLDFHKNKDKKSKTRECGICEHSFRIRTKFDRFCEECKDSDAYHFSETLPTVNIG